MKKKKMMMTMIMMMKGRTRRTTTKAPIQEQKANNESVSENESDLKIINKIRTRINRIIPITKHIKQRQMDNNYHKNSKKQNDMSINNNKNDSRNNNNKRKKSLDKNALEVTTDS